MIFFPFGADKDAPSFALRPVRHKADGDKAVLLQLAAELRARVGVFDMLLAAAAPQRALALKKVHAVDETVLALVKIRPPQAEQILILVDGDAAVQRAQTLRRFDIKDQQPAGAHEQVQAPEHLAEIFPGEIVHPVERADRGVDRAVQIQLLRALAAIIS